MTLLSILNDGSIAALPLMPPLSLMPPLPPLPPLVPPTPPVPPAPAEAPALLPPLPALLDPAAEPLVPPLARGGSSLPAQATTPAARDTSTVNREQGWAKLRASVVAATERSSFRRGMGGFEKLPARAHSRQASISSPEH